VGPGEGVAAPPGECRASLARAKLLKGFLAGNAPRFRRGHNVILAEMLARGKVEMSARPYPLAPALQAPRCLSFLVSRDTNPYAVRGHELLRREPTAPDRLEP
jgi:hypothetical protein